MSDDDLPTPGEFDGDAVRVYLEQMARTPLLTKEQEVALARKVHVTRRRFRKKLHECDYAARLTLDTLRKVRDGHLAFDKTIQESAADGQTKAEVTARLAANVLSRSDDDIEREIDEESRQMETMLAQNFPDIPKQTPEQISEQKNIARHQHFDDLHKAAIAWHRWRGLLPRTDA